MKTASFPRLRVSPSPETQAIPRSSLKDGLSSQGPHPARVTGSELLTVAVNVTGLAKGGADEGLS